MSQRDAVYKATVEAYEIHTNTLWVHGVDALSGLTFGVRQKVRAMVYDIVIDWFKKGKIAYSPQFKSKMDNDHRYLTSYARGLISNWWRKDPKIGKPVDWANSSSLKPTLSLPDEIPKAVEQEAWSKLESESECQCGAKHTSNPNHHLSYCPKS